MIMKSDKDNKERRDFNMYFQPKSTLLNNEQTNKYNIQEL